MKNYSEVQVQFYIKHSSAKYIQDMEGQSKINQQTQTNLFPPAIHTQKRNACFLKNSADRNCVANNAYIYVFFLKNELRLPNKY